MAWMGKRIIKKFDAVVTLGYVLQNRVSYMVIQFGKMCTSTWYSFAWQMAPYDPFHRA